jgi:hypothetical protein
MTWNGSGRRQLWSNLQYYPSTYLAELTKTTNNLSQHIQCPNHESNLALPEYEGVLSIQLRYSVKDNIYFSPIRSVTLLMAIKLESETMKVNFLSTDLKLGWFVKKIIILKLH